MTIDKLRQDPFRLCFPVGIAFALHASALWMFYIFVGAGPYPGLVHARLFIGGFLYYFILGFLMTAVPRFTQTPSASRRELAALVVQIIAMIATLVIGNELLIWLSMLAGWILLAIYTVSRFNSRTHNPPVTFIFIGLGIFIGLVGYASIVVFHAIPGASTLWLFIGKICVYDVTVLSLILGVGGRLVPGILGFDQMMPMQLTTSPGLPPYLTTIPRSLLISSIALVASVVLEVMALPLFAYLVRASVITLIAVQYWNLHRAPGRRTWFTLMIRWSCALILLSAWLMVATSADPIAAKHIVYIGGYALITLLIGGRVTMSHSGMGSTAEERKHPYLTIGTFLVLAALTRASANYMPQVFNSHLGYAALCVLITAIVWAVSFVPVIVRKRA